MCKLSLLFFEFWTKCRVIVKYDMTMVEQRISSGLTKIKAAWRSCVSHATHLTVKPYTRFIVVTLFCSCFRARKNYMYNMALKIMCSGRCSTNNGPLLNSNRKFALLFQWHIWLHQFTYVSLFEWISFRYSLHTSVTPNPNKRPKFRSTLYEACTLRLLGKILCKTYRYLRSSLVFCLFLLASTIAIGGHRTMAPIAFSFSHVRAPTNNSKFVLTTCIPFTKVFIRT